MFNYGVFRHKAELTRLKTYYLKYYNSSKPRKNKLLSNAMLMQILMESFNGYLQHLTLNNLLGGLEKTVVMNLMTQSGTVHERKNKVLKMVKVSYIDRATAIIDQAFLQFCREK